MLKPGTRALGVAESFRESTSTLCGAVVTTRGRVDEFAFERCIVGGTDVTDAVLALWERIDREDVQYCLISGVAPAWFNVIDLERLENGLPMPVIALTFEDGEDLAAPIREAFEPGEAADRLRRYRALPERVPVSLGDATIYARSTELENAAVRTVVRAYTVSGARPEPVRVARLAARAADRYRTDRSG